MFTFYFTLQATVELATGAHSSPAFGVSTAAKSILHAAAVVGINAAVTILQEGNPPSRLQSDTTGLLEGSGA